MTIRSMLAGSAFGVGLSVTFPAAIAAAPVSTAPTFKTVFSVPGISDGAAPLANLVNVNGIYYGTASGGGAPSSNANNGIIFSYNPATGTKTTLYGFAGGTDGSAPVAGMIAYHGLLYGTTSAGGGSANAGTLFSFDPASGIEKVLYSFKGAPADQEPITSLVAAGGLLYGTTAVGGDAESGTIFSFDPATGTETTLYQFGVKSTTDGFGPAGAMIAVGNVLYGTTQLGGKNSRGTIFSFDPSTNTEIIQYNFTGGSDGGVPLAPLLNAGGLLWGTASIGGSGNGTVFNFNLTNGTLTPTYAFQGDNDGGMPEAGLTLAGKLLYGTTSGLNANSNGSLFVIDPSTGHEKTLYSFNALYDGTAPGAALLNDGGKLYGVAQSGGFTGNGTIFSYDRSADQLAELWNFTGTQNSYGSQLVQSRGNIYGSATGAGTYGYGSVFRVNAKSGVGMTLYSFQGGADGMQPSGTLVATPTGLYGVTRYGGTTNSGTIFSLGDDGTKTILYSFANNGDGAQPAAGLIQVGKMLYGTTYLGGTNGCGTIFSFDPASHTRTTLYNFTGSTDGEYPWSPLYLTNNVLYGVTLNGGIQHNGVLFAYDLGTNTEKTAYDFEGKKDGGVPFGGPVAVGSLLYGTTTSLGDYPYNGTIYSLDTSTDTETVLYHFNIKTIGVFPYGNLTAIGNVLYGTTSSYGASFNGAVFGFDLTTNKVTTLHAFTGGTDSGLPQAGLLPVGGILFGTTSALNGNGTVFSITP